MRSYLHVRRGLCFVSSIGLAVAVLCRGAGAASPCAGADPRAHLSAGGAVVFDVHDGYFVSNKFEPDAAASFAVIRDQKTFDDRFGIARVMNEKTHRLPANTFASKIVLAVVKRGPALVTFKVESVSVEAGVVMIRYTTASQPSDTATFACPLIVSIPKGNYSAVQFIEDGKAVKKVWVGDG